MCYYIDSDSCGRFRSQLLAKQLKLPLGWALAPNWITGLDDSLPYRPRLGRIAAASFHFCALVEDLRIRYVRGECDPKQVSDVCGRV